jgi:acetyl esterase/lipase
MHPSCLPELVQLYVPAGDVRNPLVSPVFGDYTGIPPLFIQVGESLVSGCLRARSS